MLINIDWEGPFTLKEMNIFNDPDKDIGLYHMTPIN